MNDDLEQRLRAVGNRPVAGLPASKVQAIEDRVLGATTTRRRPLWLPYVAAAAALFAGGGLVYGMQGGDTRDSLHPAEQLDVTTSESHTTTTHGDGDSSTTTTLRRDEPTTTLEGVPLPTAPGEPTSTEPSGTEPPHTTEPRTTEPPRTTQPPSTEPPHTTAPHSTEPPHTTVPPSSTAPSTTAPPSTEAPSTTSPPSSIPSPSFTITVERSGDKLIWHWPQAGGGGAHHYVLMWVTPAGVTDWPMDGHQIFTSGGLGTTTVQETYAVVEPRRWVLAVVTADNHLVAISSIAISN